MVLHLSLRDLAPEMILAAQNFTDDIDHAVRERTSLHLTEQRTGNRDFVDGTLADLLRGRLRRHHGRPAIFSPFGLGVLDLAVGCKWVHDRVVAAGRGRRESDFFTGVGASDERLTRPALRRDRYVVVANHEEQYSVWFADRELPNGWTATGARGTRQECLEHIEQVWTDLTPSSVRGSR